MENQRMINQLADYLNKEITGDYLVIQKELREGARDHYIRLKLADKTGSITANVWNNALSIAEKFAEGEVVRVKGIVISYKSQIQLTVNKLRRLDSEEYNLADFIATTSKNINKLSDKLFEYVESIKDENIKALLLSIFDDKEFYNKFLEAPAAKTWHHNYMGGLIEHTVSVTMICDFASHLYPVHRDLLLAGALLHDIGKVYEYETKPGIEFSTEGRLIGHLSLADHFVADRAAKINNFPRNLLMKIRHLILAHHGEYEKASCRLPQTIEAVVLHFADNLDAQTIGVKQVIEGISAAQSEWSEFDRLNNRYYYIR